MTSGGLRISGSQVAKNLSGGPRMTQTFGAGVWDEGKRFADTPFSTAFRASFQRKRMG